MALPLRTILSLLSPVLACPTSTISPLPLPSALTHVHGCGAQVGWVCDGELVADLGAQHHGTHVTQRRGHLGRQADQVLLGTAEEGGGTTEGSGGGQGRQGLGNREGRLRAGWACWGIRQSCYTSPHAAELLHMVQPHTVLCPSIDKEPTVPSCPNEAPER